MVKEIDVVNNPFINLDMVTYKYCYECGVVVGKPGFTYREVVKEVEEKHQGHCLAQSEHDNKHK